LVKETPEPFPLPTEAPVVQASSGWAHCAVVTGKFNFSTLASITLHWSMT